MRRDVPSIEERIEAVVGHIRAIMESGRNPTLPLIVERAGIARSAIVRTIYAGMRRGRIVRPGRGKRHGYRYRGDPLWTPADEGALVEGA